MSPAPTRAIALVEDDVRTREALASRIRSSGRYSIAWTAGRLASARESLRQNAADLLIVDLGLPDGSGLELVREARECAPSLPILVLTVFGDEQKVIGAIEQGAIGYLLKDEDVDGVITAIDDTFAGGSPISPSIARHLLRRIRPSLPSMGVAIEGETNANSETLTARETEVLSLAAKGFNHQEIAGLLGLTANTVSTYTRRIYQKLDVGSRAEAVFEATRMGILPRTS